ncbi:MAG: DUF6348 family protein [Pirellulales bacterium]
MMIDDLYQAALAAMRHHLDEAQLGYTVDDGELVVGSHRLGLSITFDGCVPQGEHVLAPLDIQIHVDGDNGDPFRVGALGVGADQTSAVQDAISEWHLLAVAPLMSALGASVDLRRAPPRPQQWAGWDIFPGRVGIRGPLSAALRPEGAFYRALLERLKRVVSRWELPPRFTLHSIYMMATCGPGLSDIQAAVDGLVSEQLTGLLQGLPWPTGGETYLYKQLFVFRHQPPE